MSHNPPGVPLASPLCPDSDQIPHRTEMTRVQIGDIVR